MIRNQIVITFSEWTAFKAISSGCPVKARKKVYPLIRAIDFDVLFDADKGPISKEEFNGWHKANAEKLQRISSKMQIGWTTKLINVYLKTRAYTAGEGRPNLQEVIHPPIDGGLWRGIAKRFKDQPRITKLTHTESKIKDITSYQTYSQIIEGCRLAAEKLGCKLIEVDQLWLGTET